ncbi:MAG: hypothetical protein ACLPUO_24845 [Streptosporangiaceae bacterium]
MPSRGGGDRGGVEDQGRGVVEERLAFEDGEQPPGDGKPAGDVLAAAAARAAGPNRAGSLAARYARAAEIAAGALASLAAARSRPASSRPGTSRRSWPGGARFPLVQLADALAGMAS